MPKPNVLLVISPDHYSLRNIASIKEEADVLIGGTKEFVAEHGPSAQVVLYSGLGGEVAPFPEIWPYLQHARWIHSLSAGVEKYLTPEFIASSVILTNARGVFKRSLADFVILGVLYFSKRVRRLIESQRAGNWDSFSVDWIPDKVLGVVGYGAIGRECGRLAKALGMKVYALRRRHGNEQASEDPVCDRAFAPHQLAEMLPKVDFLVAAAPLTSETHHMLSGPQFSLMKPTAVVMNVGRGPVIDEQALVTALQDKTIAGAALDVFETEPLPKDSPLWQMENVLLSPHCTDRTHDPDWLDLSMRLFVQNFERFQAGEPLLNIVDKKAGY